MNRHQMVAHLVLLGWVARRTGDGVPTYASSDGYEVVTFNNVYSCRKTDSFPVACMLAVIEWPDVPDDDVRGIFKEVIHAS